MRKTFAYKIATLFITALFLFYASGLPSALAHNEAIPGGTSPVPPANPGGGGPPPQSRSADAPGVPEATDPVDIDKGDFFLTHQDLFLAGRGFSVDLSFMYRSKSAYNGQFGYGWDFSYNRKLRKIIGGNIILLTGDNRKDEFSFNAGTYNPPPGVYASLVQNENGTYTLSHPQGKKESFDINGNLTRIEDRSGNALTFTYSAGPLPIQGKSDYFVNQTFGVIAKEYRLTQITDTVGRTIDFAYNADGRLASVTYAGRATTYTYDPSGSGELLSVTTPPTAEFPNGLTTQYAYDAKHNLITVTDPKGQTYLTSDYDLATDRVTSQTYGAGTTTLAYDSVSPITTMTDRKGFQSRWTFNGFGNPTRKEVFTTGPTYLTQWVYNSQLEQSRIIFPNRNAVDYTYDEANADPRMRGNLLEIRRRGVLNLGSNVALGKTATASAIYSSTFPASKVVDGLTTEAVADYWLLPNGQTGWVKVDLAAVYDIGLIKFLNTHNRTSNDRATTRWHIESSLDNVTFTPIPAASGEEVFTSTPSFREIPVKVQARYIRFHVDGFYNLGGGLNELEVYPFITPVEPDLVTTFTYEPNYQFVKTITDPRGNVTTYTYDYELGEPNKGNLRKITYPSVDGQTIETIFTYNAFGQVDTVTDPNGNLTKYEYDSTTGNLIRITNGFGTPDAAITRMTYDSFGNITFITDARGNTTTFQYDALNKLTQVTSPSPFSFLTPYFYDENGNLRQVDRETRDTVNPWITTTYAYTNLDQLQMITDELGNSTTFTYDANGNRTSIQDANLKTTTYTYDERNLLFRVADANLGVTEYSYDPNGNLTELKDANINPTTYIYDAYDRLTQTTYADSSFETYTYDSASNLSTLRTPNSALMEYTYDALNRLTLKTYPDSTAVDYIYDVGSRLSSIQYLASSIAYQYDVLNRVKRVDTTVDSLIYPTTYQYDGVGNRTQLTYPSGTTLSYLYDSLNRLTNIKQNSSYLANFTYDALSRRTQKDLLFGNTKRTDYSYDPLSRLTGLQNHVVIGPPPRKKQEITPAFLWPFRVNEAEAVTQPLITSRFFYTYDNVGNRLGVTGSQNETYAYDNLYQLTGVTGSQTHSYTYDPLGNRQLVDGVSYTPNNLNQYLTVGGTPYTYDDNGNLTGDGTKTYSYDFENRLTGVTGPGLTATYAYDGFGRRVKKTVNGVVTYYLHDGDQVIEERGSGGVLQATYTYGAGIDEQLTMNRNSQTYYYFYDGLGSVTDLTKATGELVESYQYDAYGQPNTPSTVGNPYMFTGREYDQETGLYYYRARFYHPGIGRFLQRDPLDQIDSPNLYTYVLNNPLNHVDPLGLLVILGERRAFGPGSHSTIIIIPDNPGDFAGDPHFKRDQHLGIPISTLSGGPSGPAGTGRLRKFLNHPDDQFFDMRTRWRVATPPGMSDTEFIRNLFEAYDSYQQDSLPYDALVKGDGYNSNSLTSGFLNAAGQPQVPNLPGWQPGTDKPVPLPRKAGKIGGKNK